MKTISKAELTRMKACKSVLERFIKQTNNTDDAVLVSDLFDGENTLSDLIWLARRLCTVDKIKKFARDVAMVNIELIKPYCSDTDYESTIHFMKTGENARAAFFITRNAVNAATAAHAINAAYTAHAAARATYVAYAAKSAAVAVEYAMKTCEFDIKPFLQELFS